MKLKTFYHNNNYINANKFKIPNLGNITLGHGRYTISNRIKVLISE